MRKIPPYAAHVAYHRLVSIQCQGTCKARRWAELVPLAPGVPLRLGLPFAGNCARCCMCGYLATDNAAWVGP